MATSPGAESQVGWRRMKALRANRSAAAFPPLTVIAAVLSALVASGVGFLESVENYPALKLGGAMLLAVAGTSVVLAIRYLAAGPETAPPGIPPAGEDASSPASATALTVVAPCVAFLSMAAAVIHFAVIQQHVIEFVLYGVFFIVIGAFQAGSAILVLTRPSRSRS
jgi:hypothetical protein